MSSQPDNPPSNALIEQLWAVCIRAAAKRGAHHGEAEVVAQETMMKVLKQWETEKFLELRSEGQQALSAYVAKLAHHTLFDEVRKYERRVAREQKVSGLIGDPLADRPNVIRARPQPRQPSGLEERRVRESIADLILHLKSQPQRTCLWMVYVEGHTPSEIAEILGLAPQTVRYHVRAGHERLREQLTIATLTETDHGSGNEPEDRPDRLTLSRMDIDTALAETEFDRAEFGDALDDPENVVCSALGLLSVAQLQQFVRDPSES